MSSEETSVFGARLKEARLRVGLSQKQLGIAAGLDPFVASTRINRYELGIHKVDYQFAKRLAAVLSVSVAYLYADDPELAELIDLYGGLPSERKEHLLTLARELALR
ncbi:helix-turn-helix transcriptional regulator [Burkholderia cenocepacia]|uniref:helix-turn-helix domain-containing protein n=1 Tax=Burkholderia TaxID=32008 RepID=UPI000A1A1604|nr:MULTISPECIES: helix-turn-helix transcriptional regulator [Burkholderia]ARL30154.1 transcriptional regulator [Burkholderia pseudomallei]ARL74385.1 transcriptional regulator [Burkholderia pseudomallei]ARL78707.1 transcriptional regulator [Burkholderia pseudomallei]ELW9449268.1 helix-turn-helix transcriptional regulator [Burkholderia cenocepacia]MBR8485208.1 helix-turn-helix transcriptional regulator [Burkholderia cenocepacia]